MKEQRNKELKQYQYILKNGDLEMFNIIEYDKIYDAQYDIKIKAQLLRNKLHL